MVYLIRDKNKLFLEDAPIGGTMISWIKRILKLKIKIKRVEN
jgi:hypothetical protein